MVNNHQAKNHSTMIKMLATIANRTFSILIDLGSKKIFISGVVLKRVKVKEVEQDEFSYMEMASGAK
jgi:hypothetical protein